MRSAKRFLFLAILIAMVVRSLVTFVEADERKGERIEISSMEIIDSTGLLGAKLAIINGNMLVLMGGDYTTHATHWYVTAFYEFRNGAWSDGRLYFTEYYSVGKANEKWGYREDELVHIQAPIFSDEATKIRLTLDARVEVSPDGKTIVAKNYQATVIVEIPERSKSH